MISLLPSTVLPSILVILLSRCCCSSTIVHAGGSAFVRSSSSFARRRAISNLNGCHRRRLRTASSVVRVGNDDDDGDGGDNYDATTTTTNTIDRREALSRSTSILAGVVASSSTIVGLRPSPALASPPSAVGVDAATRARTTSPSSSSSAIVPSGGGVAQVLCDPSVSTWARTYDDGGGGIGGGSALRTVHILGTAHISSSSAVLAGRMVRDLRPDVVFVELDAKRVARAIPGGGVGGGGAVAAPGGAGAGGYDAAGSGNDPTAPPAAATTKTTTKTSVIAASPPPRDGASSSAATTNPFDVQSRLVDAGSKVVGESVRGMYTKLESEGFKAGDEFATSVREGLAIGSTIVLGDRDVEITLRRLTMALAKTDIRKLLSPDSEVEKSMEGLLPEGMKKSLTGQSSSSGGGGRGNDTGDASKMTSMGMEVSIDKDDFNGFVETMKARENVRKIMSALRSTAPEIYEAMVAERDEYMGRGLDELGSNLPGRSSGRTVAVVGMAHVDGIERYLASRGWTEMSYPCPR